MSTLKYTEGDTISFIAKAERVNLNRLKEHVVRPVLDERTDTVRLLLSKKDDRSSGIYWEYSSPGEPDDDSDNQIFVSGYLVEVKNSYHPTYTPPKVEIKATAIASTHDRDAQRLNEIVAEVAEQARMTASRSMHGEAEINKDAERIGFTLFIPLEELVQTYKD